MNRTDWTLRFMTPIKAEEYFINSEMIESTVSRAEVYLALDEELDYQNSLQACGVQQRLGYGVPYEIITIARLARLAIERLVDNPEDNAPALDLIRRLTAVGIRCMEQNGVVSRVTTGETDETK